MNVLPILATTLIPAIVGAWLVLAMPVGSWPQRITSWAALGAFLVMAVGIGLFVASPWFQQNNNWSTRDPAAVAAVQPYVFATWTALIIALCFGTGGWIASVIRENKEPRVVAAFIAVVALPAGLLVSTILLGCFFAGVCL